MTDDRLIETQRAENQGCRHAACSISRRRRGCVDLPIGGLYQPGKQSSQLRSRRTLAKAVQHAVYSKPRGNLSPAVPPTPSARAKSHPRERTSAGVAGGK